MENSFNSSLKRIRKEKGITQEQLADKVGVSPQAVSKWELSSYPDPQLLPAIADYLGVTIDELFGRAPEKDWSTFMNWYGLLLWVAAVLMFSVTFPIMYEPRNTAITRYTFVTQVLFLAG